MKVVGTWRGQPLAAMVVFFVVWIAVRMVMWELGFEPLLPPLFERAKAQRVAALPRPVTSLPAMAPEVAAIEPAGAGKAVDTAAPRATAMSVGMRTGRERPARVAPVAAALPATTVPGWPRPLSRPHGPASPAGEGVPPPQSSFPSAIRSPARRWSADGWLLAREGGGAGLGGAAPATYGASQAGAVLRYRLSPADPHRAAAYARATAALGGSREKELALGLSARPLAALPVIIGVELRAGDQPGGRRVRPAVLLVSEVPPLPLPAGLRAEIYGQAGYVGGRFATGFADGQLRVDRAVTQVGRGELRLGGGGWGGAQKGVARVDLGPGATLALPTALPLSLGDGSARLAIDWRFRVAGNAAPASGPTLTLSAGF